MNKRMEMNKFFLIIIIVSIFSISCEDSISYVKVEKNIMSQVLPDLLDSLYVDIMEPVPPALAPIFTEKGEFIGVDSVGYLERLKDFEFKKANYRRDSYKPIISFRDTIQNYSKNFLKQIDEPQLFTSVNYDNAPSLVDINDYKSFENYKFTNEVHNEEIDGVQAHNIFSLYRIKV